MSDYKSNYSEEAEDYIENVVPESDIDQVRYNRSKLREEKNNDNWISQKVNLNDIINKFITNSSNFVEQYTESGIKYDFEGDRYIIKCDKVAGYLRIYDKIAKSYCKLDGTPSKNNDETHFKLKRREEM